MAPILIIDDDDTLRQFLAGLLTDEGYEVCVASGGRMALQMLEKQSLSLILLDMRMPEMDGWEFLDVYCKLPGVHTPVIAVSARTVDPSTLACAAGFLVKPFDLKSLLLTVKQHIPTP